MLRDAFDRDPLQSTRETIAIDDAIAVELDVESFESAVATGDDATAERWYGGPYLRGAFDDETVAERDRLASLHEGVLARLLRADPDPERARRLVAADPYAEIAYRVLVDASLADGATTGARAWLRRARNAFVELGTTPAFFTDALYRQLIELDDERAPRTNLAADATSFIGRHDDVRAIDEALHEARVVTLLGAGGSGKTRLAREVAARGLGTRYPAAWIVELAPFEGANAVESAVAAALGLREDVRSTAVVVEEAFATATRCSCSIIASTSRPGGRTRRTSLAQRAAVANRDDVARGSAHRSRGHRADRRSRYRRGHHTLPRTRTRG